MSCICIANEILEALVSHRSLIHLLLKQKPQSSRKNEIFPRFPFTQTFFPAGIHARTRKKITFFSSNFVNETQGVIKTNCKMSKMRHSQSFVERNHLFFVYSENCMDLREREDLFQVCLLPNQGTRKNQDHHRGPQRQSFNLYH